MRREGVTISREQAYRLLEALGRAMDLAVASGALVDQILFEEVYGVVRDATLPDVPRLRPPRESRRDEP
jgi:hypothetical protein